MRIFFMTGAAIGIVGTICRRAARRSRLRQHRAIRQFFSWLSGTVLFDPQLYFLSQLPAKMDLNETFSVVLMALTLSFHRNDLPGMACSLQARSCAGPALRIRNAHFMKRNTVLKLSGVERHYGQGETQLSILKGPISTLNSGEIVALVARPAPESRRCCISPACSSIPIAARSASTATRATDCPTTSARRSAAARSASSTSSTICCRSFRQLRTS
jgi:hypothetical protein